MKDTLVTGSLRVTDTIFSTNLNLSSLTASYAVLTDANKNLVSRGITNNTSATAVTASTNLITANTLYYHKGNSNIVTVGTISSGTWSATTINPNKGGTGINSYAKGDILYAGSAIANTATTALSKLALGTAGYTLQATANGPAWTQTVAVANGGTGKTSWTQWGVLYASASTTLANTAAGTAGYLLQGNGSAAPSWIQATNANTASTIVKRDASGNFSAGTLNIGYLEVRAQDSTYEGGEIKLLPATSSLKACHIDNFNNTLRIHDGSDVRFYIDVTTGNVVVVGNKLYVGATDATAETDITLYGKDGSFSLFSHAGDGIHGLWAHAHGTDTYGKSVFLLDTNNVVTFYGALSGNATTATNADKVDDWHRDDIRKGCLSFTRNIDSANPSDLNNLNDGMAYNYGGGSYWQHAPSGASYGSAIALTSGGAITLGAQFFWDVTHNSSSSTRNLWFRAANNLGWQNDWKQIVTNSGSWSISVDTATRINGNLGSISDSNAHNIWVSSGTGADGIPKYISGVTIVPSSKTLYINNVCCTNVYCPNYTYHLSMQNDGNLVIYSGSGGAVWSTGTSTKYVKENINSITDIDISNFMRINPVSFNYKPEMNMFYNSKHYGVIAEELLDIYPNLVEIPENYDQTKFDINKGFNQPLIRVNYEGFIPLLIKMVQKQQKEINELREQLNKFNI